MNIYPALMETDLERFEHLFSYKKKSLEEFLSLMAERAELEENYARAVERLSSNLTIYTDRGPLAEVLNSIKSYHAVKCEQSKIFAASIREEVVQTLKNMLKKESNEARKTLLNGKRNDLEMRAILEKIESARKKYITLNSDLEEAQKTKALLFNMELNDPNAEDKRRSIVDKLNRLVNARFDCDLELKSHIDEYNKFKATFNEENNKVVEYFKHFDIKRLNTFRDSTMKYFVYEISYFRNIQYDVNRLIGVRLKKNVENAEFTREISESSLYKPKVEPSPMDFHKFKELFINKPTEEKTKGGIIFERTQIPENLGISTALKSIVGFFSTPKAGDIKRRDEEAKFLEKQWNMISQGQTLSEGDTQSLIKLLTYDYNRKLFINLFSKIEINLDEVPEERSQQAKDTVIQVLRYFLNEVWQNKDWESLKLYISSMRRLQKYYDSKQDETGKRDVYSEIDSNLRSMEIFNSEGMWREYLVQNIIGKDKQIKPEMPLNLMKMAHEITNMKHFIKSKEQLIGIVKPVASELRISEEDIEKLTEDKQEVESPLQASQEKELQRKENEKEEPLDSWIQNMEQKMLKVEKAKKSTNKTIFSKKPHSNPLSPLKNITLAFDNNKMLPHSESDKTIQADIEKQVQDPKNGEHVDNKEGVENKETSVNVETSYVGSVSTEAQDFSNM